MAPPEVATTLQAVVDTLKIEYHIEGNALTVAIHTEFKPVLLILDIISANIDELSLQKPKGSVLHLRAEA